MSPNALRGFVPTSPAPSAPTPALLELFVAFALISLYGFGGVLAWSRRTLVEERGWMTAEEFNDAYALCQFRPGPTSSTCRRFPCAARRGRGARLDDRAAVHRHICDSAGDAVGTLQARAVAGRDPSGLLPIPIGLIAASAFVVASAAAHNIAALAITLAAAVAT